MLFTFNLKYLSWAVVLFLVEIIIAVFVHDHIIRPYVGDLLVVILLYCGVRAFLNLPVWMAALIVLIFSYCVEILQYFHIIRLLGLQQSPLANIVFGNYFQWMDFVAYSLGIAIVVGIEKYGED
jgi:hypothetical protein